MSEATSNGETVSPTPVPVVVFDQLKTRIEAAFDESPYLYDEVLDIWEQSESLPDRMSGWYLKSKTGATTFTWLVIPDHDADMNKASGFSFIEVSRDPPQAEDAPFIGYSAKVGGGLLPGPVLLDEEPRTLAELMGTEIREALGESPTPETCERAIAMTTAARDFLRAQRTYVPTTNQRINENFQNMAKVFGIGARDDDPFP